MPRYSGPSLRVFVNGGWVSEPIRHDFGDLVRRFGEMLAESGRVEMATADVVEHWEPGSFDQPWSWDDEQREVAGHEWTPQVRASIEADGIVEPVLLGDDGRVWDGHHRVCIALELGLERVPVAFPGMPNANEATEDAA